jgi:hypothetical protein
MTPASGDFQWSKHPEATEKVLSALQEALNAVPWLQKFQADLHQQTGTRLLDWVDRIVVPSTADDLKKLGFEPLPVSSDSADSPRLWRHSKAKLPDVIRRETLSPSTPRWLALKVESIIDFLVAQQSDDARCPIVGEPGSALRRALIRSEADWEIWIVERHGGWHWNPVVPPALSVVAQVSQDFRLRPRNLPDDGQGFDLLEHRVQAAISEVGVARACSEFFAAERAFWQGRNHAGQLQYMRQQGLGLGWANHDHHTYRSSRHCFYRLIRVMELLGLECRERFYAGHEAGWGAQVMEQPETGIVVFADVDLAPDEIVRDFAHEPLPERDRLGTVGLWCALHGEAILQAGMHHLECQFDFDAARAQLTALGSASMNPFTDLPHLRQSFTVGERWPICEKRIARALDKGWITSEQAVKFRREGAIGSHLEILQRNDGFKGFNPKGISDIILETDPRLQAHRDSESLENA